MNDHEDRPPHTGFYVTLRPPQREGWVSVLLGPYDTDEEAAADIGRAAQEVKRLHPPLGEGVYGVERATAVGDQRLVPGCLNKSVGPLDAATVLSTS
ncbi:hypothetical protein ACG83_10195 [Frankia sp. R43]|uniref:hypothetical protein n=1 Tax=Frankia sp. R43 TaxID=269536 RepID=UPI0006CA542A|nr:hypothetical protein [Frankia sp. R43]KPM55652.1 hypothetical protein ACG83_10195 [Frankia sp. R43]